MFMALDSIHLQREAVRPSLLVATTIAGFQVHAMVRTCNQVAVVVTILVKPQVTPMCILVVMLTKPIRMVSLAQGMVKTLPRKVIIPYLNPSLS